MVDYRSRCFERHERSCFACASEEHVEVHHLDGDRDNNDPGNLIPLCRDCHTELHREGLGGLERLLKPVEDRSHIDDAMTTFGFTTSRETWEEWKMTVPRNKSLEKRIIELIEADTEGRVRERDEDE